MIKAKRIVVCPLNNSMHSQDFGTNDPPYTSSADKLEVTHTSPRFSDNANESI